MTTSHVPQNIVEVDLLGKWPCIQKRNWKKSSKNIFEKYTFKLVLIC